MRCMQDVALQNKQGILKWIKAFYGDFKIRVGSRLATAGHVGDDVLAQADLRGDRNPVLFFLNWKRL